MQVLSFLTHYFLNCWTLFQRTSRVKIEENTNQRGRDHASSQHTDEVRTSVVSLGTSRDSADSRPSYSSVSVRWCVSRPLEVSLATLGTVMSIIVEICWKIYRYSVVNGIRQFTIKLSRHITSYLTVITVQKTLAV